MEDAQGLPALSSASLSASQAAGDRASIRFVEFFASTIRDPHTQRAYGRAVADFLAWRRRLGVGSHLVGDGSNLIDHRAMRLVNCLHRRQGSGCSFSLARLEGREIYRLGERVELLSRFVGFVEQQIGDPVRKASRAPIGVSVLVSLVKPSKLRVSLEGWTCWRRLPAPPSARTQ